MKPSIMKESKQDRLDRVNQWQTTRTKIVNSKKAYDRNKFKKINLDF